MTAKDRADAEERKWRQHREAAAANLRAAERTLRLVLFARILPIVAFLVALPSFLLTGALVFGLAATVCVAALGFDVLRVAPRTRRVIDERRRRLDHAQLRYDDAFERMLATERGDLELEPARMLSEPAKVTDWIARSGGTIGLAHCPGCGEPGDDLGVRHHGRHVVGDNETWIVCHAGSAQRLWRFDPNAPSAGPAGCSEHRVRGAGGVWIQTPEIGCAGCAGFAPARVTFSCPLCGAQGHRSGLDAHDIAVPAGHERQILGESEVWIVCPEPMSWTRDRWRYEWS